MPDTATVTAEIDCPYFQTDWTLDHPDWPPDQRLTATAPTLDTTQEH